MTDYLKIIYQLIVMETPPLVLFLFGLLILKRRPGVAKWLMFIAIIINIIIGFLGECPTITKGCIVYPDYVACGIESGVMLPLTIIMIITLITIIVKSNKDNLPEGKKNPPQKTILTTGFDVRYIFV